MNDFDRHIHHHHHCRVYHKTVMILKCMHINTQSVRPKENLLRHNTAAVIQKHDNDDDVS